MQAILVLVCGLVSITMGGNEDPHEIPTDPRFPPDPWSPVDCQSQPALRNQPGQRPVTTSKFKFCRQLADPLGTDFPGVSYHIFWNVNLTSSKIHILQVTNAQGWVGLGISDDGSMNGHGGENSDTFGDMWTGHWWGENSPTIIDGNSGDDFPRRDKQQDTRLISGTFINNWFSIEWERLLDTGDKDDYILYPGAENYTFLLWSYSNFSLKDENGTMYEFPHQRRGHQRFNWTGDENLLHEPRVNYQILVMGSIVVIVIVVLIFFAFYKLCKNTGDNASAYADVAATDENDVNIQAGVLSDMSTSDDESAGKD